MNAKVNYILLGLFVLLLGTAMIGAILWLGSGGPRKNYDRYLVYMTESVSGLSKDAAVKYQGVDIGRVRDISLNPKNPKQVRLLLEIERGTPIKEDTVAILETQGLTGLATVNLTGGERGSKDLTKQEGEEYPVIKSKPSLLGRLDKSLSQLIENLTESSTRFNTLLKDENQAAFSKSLKNLEILTSNLSDRKKDLAELLDNLSVIVQNTRQASAHFPEITTQISTSVAALEKTANEFSAVASSLQEVVGSSGKDIQRFTGATLPEASALIQELQQTAVNLRQISEQLERDPSIILYGAPRPRPGPGEGSP
jgi:phospholipid/cholesterol/gamma-HCH transport system substrate-binding protein